jgi:hypothetical protein
MRFYKVFAQAAAYGVFIVLLGVLSNSPQYQHLDPDQAVVRLAFSHFGRPIRECHRLTQDELNALAPNMRKVEDCPRQRLPIRVEFLLDQQTVYTQTIAATGIWEDGEASVYERFQVLSGPHQLTLRMRDSARDTGFDYQLNQRVDIKELQNLVIGFDPSRKQFVIH